MPQTPEAGKYKSSFNRLDNELHTNPRTSSKIDLVLLVSDLRSLVLAFAIIGVASFPPACLFISLISFRISRHHRLSIPFQMDTAQTSSPRVGKLFLLMVLDQEDAAGLVNKVDHREWPCLD